MVSHRLTRTQKRKLQRLRKAEMQEEEQEKQRDELFNKMKPMVPQKQEWRRKGDDFAPPLPSSSGQTATLSGPTASTPEATGASGGSSG